MAKKSHKKRKKSKKPKNYEGYQYGPLRLERFGRQVAMSSDWKPGEYQKFIERFRSMRPDLKNAIDKKIQELLTIIEENDPFELLTTIAVKNCFTDPETYTESSHQGKECYVEYALSLILGSNVLGFGNHVSGETITKFSELIAGIFHDVQWYFTSEFTEGKRDKIEEELRFRSILRYLYLRGDSIQEHHIDLIEGIFKPHDDFLKRNFGITTEAIITAIRDIEDQIHNAISNLSSGWLNLKKQHELFNKFVDAKGIENFESVEDCFEQFRMLPEIQQMRKELGNFQETLDKIIFEIKVTQTLTSDLLGFLSAPLGINQQFVTFRKSLGWPTNDSIIYEKPIIKHEGKFYSFLPQLLYRRVGDIIESWIKEKDTRYFSKFYQAKRAEYLEKKALEYFKKLLPDSGVYHKLYYEHIVNGEKRRFETDGLVIFDRNLFIIEGKAGSLSLSARRGGLDRMKKDIDELVNSAYIQAQRTKQHIELNDKPRFEYENGSEALVITDKGKIENIFLVNVTLENLGDLATRLNSLKPFNLIQGKEWPWSVFINDLRIISEIIEFPSEFLTFLKRRIRANDFPQFSALDELDFLMFYLREGLYLEEMDKKTKKSFTLHGYSEPIDRYYDFLAGRVSSGEKPRLKTNEEFITLVKNIESIGKGGFTNVTTRLLSFSAESHNKIIESLSDIKLLSIKDGKTHDATFYFKDDNLGVTFFMCTEQSWSSIQGLKDHCRLKMYQTRYENWIAILIPTSAEITSPNDFIIFKKKWEFDSQLEQRLDRFKSWKKDQLGIKGQKIGRNDPCPCGSGMKFKKCCGR